MPEFVQDQPITIEQLLEGRSRDALVQIASGALRAVATLAALADPAKAADAQAIAAEALPSDLAGRRLTLNPYDPANVQSMVTRCVRAMQGHQLPSVLVIPLPGNDGRIQLRVFGQNQVKETVERLFAIALTRQPAPAAPEPKIIVPGSAT